MDPLTSPVVEVFRRRWRRAMLATALMVVVLAGAKADVAESFGIPLGRELLAMAAGKVRQPPGQADAQRA